LSTFVTKKSQKMDLFRLGWIIIDILEINGRKNT